MLAGLAGCACDAEPSESDRVRQRLERTPVHVALAIREALASRGDDAATRAFLRLAEGDDEAAAVVAADAFWERRERGRALLEGGADRELGSVLGTGAEHAERDRLLYLLALVDIDAREARLPKDVLLYEASRLRPERLDARAQPLALALRASILARASACTSARSDADQALRATVTDELGAALDAPPGTVAPWAAAGTRLLAHGALACCAMRNGEDSTASALEDLLEDARELRAGPTTLALLETWSAIGAGDVERAREALSRAERTERMTDEEWAKYQQLRDRLAAPDVPRTALVDRAWLSTTTARLLADSLEQAGFFDAERSPTAGQVWRLAHATATVLSTARARHPTFDTAAQEGNFWAAMGQLFGGGSAPQGD